MNKRIIAALVMTLLLWNLVTITGVADDSKQFDPKQTNKNYQWLILRDSYTDSDSKIALDGIEFDNSLLWAVDGWSRAFLIVSLSEDLAENNKALFDKYTSNASSFYIALIPSLQEGDSSFTYSIMLFDGTTALSFTYTPGSAVCGYKEVEGISQENIENLNIIATNTWEVTAEDFSEMSETIPNAGKIFSIQNGTVEQVPKPSNTPQPTPTPKVYSYTRSELETIAKKCVLKELKAMDTVKYGYLDLAIDDSRTECYVSSVWETNQGWIAEGSFVIISWTNMAFQGSYSVTIPNDAPSSRSSCEIDSNLKDLGMIMPSASLR